MLDMKWQVQNMTSDDRCPLRKRELNATFPQGHVSQMKRGRPVLSNGCDIEISSQSEYDFDQPFLSKSVLLGSNHHE